MAKYIYIYIIPTQRTGHSHCDPGSAWWHDHLFLHVCLVLRTIPLAGDLSVRGCLARVPGSTCFRHLRCQPGNPPGMETSALQGRSVGHKNWPRHGLGSSGRVLLAFESLLETAPKLISSDVYGFHLISFGSTVCYCKMFWDLFWNVLSAI